MELYGPKKRGPKPKTFLLKVRRTAPCACQYCAVLGSEWGGPSPALVEDAACKGSPVSPRL